MTVPYLELLCLFLLYLEPLLETSKDPSVGELVDGHYRIKFDCQSEQKNDNIPCHIITKILII